MISIIDMSCFSFPASIRHKNEDSFLPPRFDGEKLVFAIADGVGSLKDSDLASKLAINAVAKTIDDGLFSIDKAFINAKAAIDALETDSATTLTIIQVNKENIIIGHLGDCRAYYVKDDKLVQLTKDHTKYQELLDSGEHKLRNLRAHKERLSSVLTLALSNKINLKYDLISIPIDDLIENKILNILLMSDGAYNHWMLRPRFSTATINTPSAFSNSLRKRIEKNIKDDYTLINIKINVDYNTGN
ncbi:PP2C family serine/threonine-protein phosphatase [Photobacterium piscicola]|uniref:PP2C family protein-serine/threonine phosphatase n=1 Tax=Photobacterium piscicola TaxID=1378299 RepID=UPI002E1968C3|nr:PP2C family serine/threonine-protein phosphatase [Photobacterium piscicola]